MIQVPHDEKVNFCWFTDIHLSAIAPGRRKDNYRAALMKKLTFCKDLTWAIKGVALVGGDVFHVKNRKSEANPLSLINESIDMFGSFPTGSVYGAVGNHDMLADSLTTLKDQPLGVLIESGVYYDLSVNPELFVSQDGNVRVLVQAYDYTEDHDALVQALVHPEPSEHVGAYRVAIVHAGGNPGPSRNQFGYHTIGYDELKGNPYDLILWGHDHTRIETEVVGKTTHINLGSIARAALVQDEVERPVVAVVCSFSKQGLKILEKEVPTTPLKAAFEIADRKHRKLESSDDVTSFFDEVDSALAEVDSEDPREIMKAICDDAAVIKLLEEVCEL